MTYVYKIGYYDYDDVGIDYLEHEKRFSKEEIHMMMVESLKEIVQEREHDTPPCLLSLSDFFGDYCGHQLARKMIKKYGFKFFRFEATLMCNSFSIFKKKDGFSDIYGIEPKCCREGCSFEEHKNRECPCDRRNDNE